MAHPGGHPTDYNDKMPELLLSMMKEGKSIVQFCSAVDICRKTFWNWREAHPEFLHAFTRGLMHSQSHWENWLGNNFENTKVNAPLFKLYWCARFGNPEKQNDLEQEPKEEKSSEVTPEAQAALDELQKAKEAYKAAMKKEY